MWVLFKGGMNLNSVPDLAEFTIDIRTIPGQDNETILRRVKAYLVMRQP
jgi:succinyl-diaminopimelate desuccinylase